jgi:hypothetical protein
MMGDGIASGILKSQDRIYLQRKVLISITSHGVSLDSGVGLSALTMSKDERDLLQSAQDHLAYAEQYPKTVKFCRGLVGRFFDRKRRLGA